MPKKQTTRLNVPAGTSQTQIDCAVRSFYLDRAAAGCASATLTWYRQYLGALVDWLTAHDLQAPQDVTSDQLRAYLVDIQHRGLAPRTVHHHASAARAFFNYLVNEQLLPEEVNPMRRVKMPKLPKAILPAFDVADVQALSDACDCERLVAALICP